MCFDSFLVLFLLLLLLSEHIVFSDLTDRVLKEILEEAERDESTPPPQQPRRRPKMSPTGSTYHNHNSNSNKFQEMEDELKNHSSQQQHKKETAEAAELERNREAVREQRERKYQAEFAKLSKEQQKKIKAVRQKDAKIVKRILKKAASEDLYGVLNVKQHWWNIRPISDKQIKKAYRTLAKTVHPDKNKDSRAEEAFAEVQRANEILGDGKSRREFDVTREQLRKERNEDILEKSSEAVELASRKTRLFYGIVSTFLGPFLLPAVLLSVLIV